MVITNLDKISLIDQSNLLFTDKSTPAHPSERPSFNSISVGNSWIQSHGRNFLWLPHKYRSAACAVIRNLVAFRDIPSQYNFIQVNYTCKTQFQE
ncbi:hypothetical protein BX600DRAFT_464751 [Xylariales sp. PMI_506]|nr:hypothetical protein BX600DRAFT_464751 [Xylariales sp. PMI_506]